MTTTIEARAGQTIDIVIKAAIEHAEVTQGEVQFEFNGKRILVDANSDPEKILATWHRVVDGCVKLDVIGPHPADLTPEEEAADKAHREEKQRKREEAAKRVRERNSRDKQQLLQTLGNEEYEFKDADAEARFNVGKAKNTDLYGGRVFEYAVQWACLMQVYTRRGQSLEDCLQTAASEADYDGISGYMHGCAVGIIADTWKRGDQFKKIIEASRA